MKTTQFFDVSGNKVELKINNKIKSAIATSANGDAIIIARISGINDRNMAENSRNFEIFTPCENFKETADDEFYYVDLIGLDVLDCQNKKIAKVINIYDFGAGSLVEIEFINKAPNGFKKVEIFLSKRNLSRSKYKKGFVKKLFYQKLLALKNNNDSSRFKQKPKIFLAKNQIRNCEIKQVAGDAFRSYYRILMRIKLYSNVCTA